MLLNRTKLNVIVLGCSLLFASSLGVAVAATVPAIYWADEWGSIGRANLDGSNRTTFLQTVGDVPPQGIAVANNGSVFWGDYRTDSIHVTSPEGSMTQVVATGAGEVRGVALDSAGGKVYWADWGGGYPTIQSANLDGSDIQNLVVSYYRPGEMVSALGVALDLPGGKVYWTDPIGGNIWSSGLDGTHAGIAISGLANPFMLDIDPVNGKVYWSSNTRIQRANLDGTGIQDVVTGLVAARGVALDVPDNKLFIVDNGAESILSANLDGSDAHTILTGVGFASGIAVAGLGEVPEPSSLMLGAIGVVSFLFWGLRFRRQSKA